MLSSSYLERIFEVSRYMAKLCYERWFSQALSAPGAVLLKDGRTRDQHIAGSNCYNSNSDRQVSKWCFVNHLSLADLCHQWLSEHWFCAQAFCRIVFLIGCCSCVQLVIPWVFQCDHCIYIFSTVNKIVLTSQDEYFSATLSNGLVLHGSSFHSALEHGDFWTQTFHKVGSNALDVWWDV